MPSYEFYEHPRFRHLCMLLLPSGASAECVYGHVARLEAFMARDDARRMAGDLTGMTDMQIEHAANWFTAPGAFAAAMRDCGLLIAEGDSIQFRGWPAHAPKYVKQRLARRTTATDGDHVQYDRGPAYYNRGPVATDGACRDHSDSDSDYQSALSESAVSANTKGEKSEGRASDADAADAEFKTAAVQRRIRAIRTQLAKQKLTLEGVHQLGALGLGMVLAAAGIADVGFRKAVMNAAKFNAGLEQHVLEICGAIVTRRATIKAPGAYVRTSLRERGFTI